MNEFGVLEKPTHQFLPSTIKYWRIAQWAVWFIGAAILSCLLFLPPVGTIVFWNILIPIAPALLVVAAGVWRNVCPLATTNLLPRHLGLSKQKKLSTLQLGKLNFVSIVALFLIVPLRHPFFNNNGIATAFLLIAMVVIGTVLGFFFEWKSAWCSGLCPIHPVEKLYGSNAFIKVPNAHCASCKNCVVPCPDSTPNVHPNIAPTNFYHRINGWLITGALPGFIWGWFHVADDINNAASHDLLTAYGLPFGGGLITLLIYIVAKQFFSNSKKDLLTPLFAAASVSCYYWFRIPSLFGFGNIGKDGLLIDLSKTIPSVIIEIIPYITTAFFFYWLVVKERNRQSWLIRPSKQVE
ncbi:MAG: hypothetical protein ACOYKE_10200 [Ferruginibacter sp.]